METTRPRVDFNFSVQLQKGEFESLSPEQKQRFFQDYLQQIHCVLMGAILTSQNKLDFIVKINANLLDQITLPEEIKQMMKSKEMIISVVYVGTGDGIVIS